MKYINKILSLFVIALIATLAILMQKVILRVNWKTVIKASALWAITPKQWKLSRE